MSEIRIASVDKPFDDPKVAHEAIRVLTRADAMGLLGEGPSTMDLDLKVIRRIVKGMSAAGIGKGLVAELNAAGAIQRRRLVEILRGVNEALDASPLPSREWSGLLRVFDAHQLGDLTSVSPASVRRYASGGRPTPDEVAARLHFLALVVGDLAGSYNEIGIRRWFRRERSALGNHSPAEALGRNWDPEAPAARKVRELASSLLGSPAT